ncbi:MAG TPA: ABC transporter permease subunit [Dongiaceae bacterium]|jgi:dipeptide transport system permease protein
MTAEAQIGTREAIERKPPHPLTEVWWSFLENRGAVGGLVVLLLVIAVAVLADVIAPYSPIEQFRDALLKPPSWVEGGSARFLLGTDDVGRDILSRLIHGARYSLFIGALTVVMSLIGGVGLGLFAGFFRGTIEDGIMRLMDIMLAIPSLLLALVIVAILGPSLTNVVWAIAIVYLPHFTRVARASVITERSKDYVTASMVSGAGRLRLMFMTVLPNCIAPLIVLSTLSFSSAILDASALGFLGLGAQAPTPEWGTMLARAREFVQSAWWVVTFPGLAILITVLASNLMGDGLRDALDPKLKR